jgi:MinD-like ATPase involved in chromosome partitioning or flagellar assembly
MSGIWRRNTPAQTQLDRWNSEERQLDAAIAARPVPPTPGSWRTVVMGAKGGDGKTPTAAVVAQICAELRGDITALLAADTHMTTLRRRLLPAGVPARLPWLDLGAAVTRSEIDPEWPRLAPYSDTVGRLRLFSNVAADPARVKRMTGQDYTTSAAFVSRAAELVFSDMGSATTDDVAVAALDSADQLIVCTKLQRDVLELTVEWVSALAGDPQSYDSGPDELVAALMLSLPLVLQRRKRPLAVTVANEVRYGRGARPTSPG